MTRATAVTHGVQPAFRRRVRPRRRATRPPDRHRAASGWRRWPACCRQRGYQVTGSDEEHLSADEHAARAPRDSGRARAIRPENLAPRPDLVVVGNKVSRGNPEVAGVLASGIPYAVAARGADALLHRRAGARWSSRARTARRRRRAMLAWVLRARPGGDPSFMVGGASLDFARQLPPRRWRLVRRRGRRVRHAFFDKGPKFLHYRPERCVLTAVEFDHADIYRDLDHVKAAFRRFSTLLPAGAPLVVARTFPQARAVLAASGRQAMLFGELRRRRRGAPTTVRDTGRSHVLHDRDAGGAAAAGCDPRRRGR